MPAQPQSFPIDKHNNEHPLQRTFPACGFGANKDSPFFHARKTKNPFPLLRLLRRLGYDPVQNRTSDINETKTREKQRQQKVSHRTLAKFYKV